MRIAVFGRGNVGGGLADLWERAGHQVTRLGPDGGDVSGAEVVLVAVPGGSIAEALDRLKGAAGKTVIDATNLYDRRRRSRSGRVLDALIWGRRSAQRPAPCSRMRSMGSASAPAP